MNEPPERTYKIRYLPTAESAFVEDIDSAVGNLEWNPFLGVVPKDARLEKMGYRMLVVGKYLVFYKVKRDLIKIYRILHGARRYTFLL